MKTRSTEDILRLLAAGADVRVSNHRPIDDLKRIAMEATARGRRLIISEADSYGLEELEAVVALAKGHVLVE